MRRTVKPNICVICHFNLDDGHTCYNLNYKISNIDEYYDYLRKLNKMSSDATKNFFHRHEYALSMTYNIMSYNQQHTVDSHKIGYGYNITGYLKLIKKLDKYREILRDFIYEERK